MAMHCQFCTASAVHCRNQCHGMCSCCCGCRPPAGGGANEKEDPGVHTILLHPLHPDQLFVSNQSSTCYLMNMNGQVIKALQSGKRQGGGEAAMCRRD